MTLSIVAHVIAISWFSWLALGLVGAVVAKLNAEERARAEFARVRRPVWRDDPRLFCVEALGFTPTDDQAAVMADVAAHSLVSWRSAQKIGKSTTLAALALWWVFTRDHALVLLTSGNSAQVRVILWRELGRLHREAKIKIGGTLHRDPQTGLSFGDGRLVIGVTASEPERMAGYSGDELLELIDEASGFTDEILEPLLGNLAGGGRAVLCGNPTRSVGLFAATHLKALPNWRRHHSSALNSPNVLAGRVVVKGLAVAAWIADMAATFGVDSIAYQVRVLGEFGAEAADAVVPLAALTSAVARWSKDDVGEGALEVGIDPARFGDDSSCIVGRRGYRGEREEQHRKLDGPALATKAMAYIAKHRRPMERVIVRVDIIGVGSSVFDQLRLIKDDRIDLVAVNSSNTSAFPARFKNVRGELWWRMRRWIQRGGALPPNDLRDAELLAARYSHDSAMRIIVADKDSMRKLLKRSPDCADALALATYSESPEDGASMAASGWPVAPRREARHWAAFEDRKTDRSEGWARRLGRLW